MSILFTPLDVTLIRSYLDFRMLLPYYCFIHIYRILFCNESSKIVCVKDFETDAPKWFQGLKVFNM